MPEYRRFHIKGGTYFFTVVSYHRYHIFSSPVARDLLHQAFKTTQTKLPFTLDAISLLPDHIHCIWTLAEGDCDNASRWRRIKGLFSQTYRVKVGAGHPSDESRIRRGELAIWQRRFWEHVIEDEKDLENHIHYIHFNAVKHGYVKRVSDWRWSSFHRYVDMGYYDNDWGGINEDYFKGKKFGE